MQVENVIHMVSAALTQRGVPSKQGWCGGFKMVSNFLTPLPLKGEMCPCPWAGSGTALTSRIWWESCSIRLGPDLKGLEASTSCLLEHSV